jgi:hypothetical protein
MSRFALLTRIAQELVNEVGTSLLPDPCLLRFPLFGEELVIHFPAHQFLHP